MKYFRAKDGIYETTNMEWCVCSKQPNHYKDKNYMLYVPIKQADTIEELCDEFVFDYYGKHFRCYYSPNTNTWVDEESGCDLHKNFVKTIKGAIWTDKGLIYVARMNENGELELL